MKVGFLNVVMPLFEFDTGFHLKVIFSIIVFFAYTATEKFLIRGFNVPILRLDLTTS